MAGGLPTVKMTDCWRGGGVIVGGGIGVSEVLPTKIAWPPVYPSDGAADTVASLPDDDCCQERTITNIIQSYEGDY